MIYISAGHHFQLPLPDPGAVAKHGGREYKEAVLADFLRDEVCRLLKERGVKYITDKDDETLRQYTTRIKPGNGSVVCEIHLNAAKNPLATGTETLVKTAASVTEWDMARELTEGTSKILGINSRGVKTETQTRHGKLAILHTGAGISALTEVCFISNADDVARFMANIPELAVLYADTLIKYDNKIS